MVRDKVAVIYHSQQEGNTHAAAQAVAQGVRADGRFEAVLHNTHEQEVSPQLLAQCAGVAFGTPDYFSYPAGRLKVFMDNWLIAKRRGNEDIEGMPVALFMTHGGGGAARGPFEDLFHHVGPQVGETVTMKGAPDDEAAEQCRELGALLAREAAAHAEGGS